MLCKLMLATRVGVYARQFVGKHIYKRAALHLRLLAKSCLARLDMQLFIGVSKVVK